MFTTARKFLCSPFLCLERFWPDSRGIILLALVGWCATAPAAEVLRGAGAILKSLAEDSKEQDTAKPVGEATKLRADLTNFTLRVATLAPASAAQEWLALLDRVAGNPAGSRFNPGQDDALPPQLDDVFMALPPPAAWDELAKAIAARPAPRGLKDTKEFGLRMLAQALKGDRTALARLSSDFEAQLLKASREESMQLLHLYRALDSALLALSDDPKAILAGVERELLAAERGREFGYVSIRLPDLVGIIGEAEATPYIRRALVSKAQQLSIEGKATTDLARKIALSVVNDMKAPRWSLLDSLDAIELYEAMEKKFAAKDEKPANAADALADMESRGFSGDYEKQRAKTYYLMALIVNGRTADAAKSARRSAEEGGELQIEVSAITSLGRAGYTEALDNFLYELLSQSPELPYWQPYFNAAANTGKTDRMLKLARAAAAKPELAGEKSGSIRENLYRALLAADLVDEGIQELRALLASAPKEPQRNGRNPRKGTSHTIEWQNHALTFARLGYLLEKPEWVTEGLTAAAPKAEANTPAEDDYSASFQIRYQVEVLVQNGRLAEAEKLLGDRLATVVKLSTKQPRYPGMGPSGSAAFEPLASLANLYHRAGRPDDVLILLEQSPHWGVKDLAALVSTQSGDMDIDIDSLSSGHFGKGPKGNRLAYAAASALVHAGRKAEARAIVDSMLNQAAGDDRAYELLIQLAGQDALPRLDELLTRDQFEERPLIWKALLLHQAGRHVEAEKVARQAISIDPSDGEQGKGDRMRVYAVLADIRAARGEAKDAEFFRGVVKAIRLSERADEFMAAGLMTRAVKMYQESLNHFADAYCIQSRLAVQLTELGQHELAAKHYQKAFELMPDSFGRVESHCFGCESTFAGTQAQGVAERVFTTLSAKNPNKPQIHYLFGYLRQQQGRGKDALPHFRRALELDPDYLNAWEHVEELGQEHRLSAAERDNVALNILRLDPLGRHATASLGTVSDFRRLWSAVESASKFQVKPPTALLQLTVSREAVEKQERDAKNQPNPYQGLHTRYLGDNVVPTSPGQALAQHPLIIAIAGLMSGSAGFGF